MAVAHLSFPALRQGSPVPLGQLVEESRNPRASTAPHHLLTSEIYSRMKSNSQIQAEPAALHFNGFSLGKGYQKFLKLINISSEVINIHIITTQTKYFRTTYTKKYRLIPGLAYTVKVHFCPDQWRYFYDCLRIHCKGEETLLIPVHAYPVIDDLCIPPHIHLPSIPLGHSVSHSLPLRCSCPADLEVEFHVHVIQAHQAFQVQPLAGSIPASGEVAITVTFRPLQYGTSQVTIQLVISQFNSKPFLCTLTGSSAPHLPTSTHEGEMPREAMLAADYRTRGVAPVIRNSAVLQVPPVLQIKRTASKKADKLKAAVQPPSPTNICTTAGVAKMLIKDGNRLQSRDLREVMSCDSIVGLRSRQLKEALFMKKVRGDVTEERANRLRWQQHLGKTPVSEQSREQILEEREITVHQYTIQWDSGHQENNVFVWGPPRLSTKRILRDARQAAVGAPCFTFYCGPELLVSLRALRLFQQAARKSLGDLTTVAVALVDITMATHVPLFQLQVPQHFKVMGYSPPLSWEAFNSYVPPSLTRPLRSGALDELLPELLEAQQASGSVRREGPGETEEQEEELRGEEDRVAEALLQSGPAQPIRIFNPAPDWQIYKPIPQYLETSAELHLCPLPRFTDNRSKKNYPDQKEVIKGVMTWKTSDWTTLRRLSELPTCSTMAERMAGRSLDLKTDMFPERVPQPLTGPSDDIDPALVDRVTEEPGVCLTQEMIRAEFLGDEELGDRT